MGARREGVVRGRGTINWVLSCNTWIVTVVLFMLPRNQCWGRGGELDEEVDCVACSLVFSALIHSYAEDFNI